MYTTSIASNVSHRCTHRQSCGMSTTSLMRSLCQAVLLLMITIPTVKSQGVCDTTPTSWNELENAIDISGGVVFLCPFTISGDNCPQETNAGYHVTSDVVLLCEPEYEGQERIGCVIDCPGTHFDISERGYLFLDGMTLQGATATAISIQKGGVLTVYDSIFEKNFSEENSGGVINAKKDSLIEINNSRFQNNQGQYGGAIFHLGDADVRGSSFLDNKATEGGGGAIYTGSDATNTLSNNLFAGNEAALFGPAAFDGSGGAIQRGNSGCGNLFSDGSPSCDGVASIQGGIASCDEFEIDCVAPTASPTSLPSISPSTTPTASSSPTSLPTITPSSSPTNGPSSAPSASPTSLPTIIPSSSPTNGPSSTPSASPSVLPSSTPTVRASSLPTVLPSQKPSVDPSGSKLPSWHPSVIPTASSLPSLGPSLLPSKTPSDIPSPAPSGSQAPSASLSLGPSTQAPRRTKAMKSKKGTKL